MSDTTTTDGTGKAKAKADDATAKAMAAASKRATDDARKQDEETTKAQESLRPFPSQDEADRIKMAAASGGLTYVTRDAKAE